MDNETPEQIFLQDYKPPAYLIDTVDLDIGLHETQTFVKAKLAIRPQRPGEPLRLHVDDIAPHEIKIDGIALKADEFELTKTYLTIPQAPASPFTLETATRIDPKANTQLMGLYMSDGIFCTQCEAEGFRRITPYLDRPDVLARFTTRIEADKTATPLLLANGNCIEKGDLPGGRHYALWRDPFPKPAYLFAMVGGRLSVVRDHFITMSGRKVALEIYVEPGKENRCAWAMDSLKRSFKWDEEAFGREYDLDSFMIVAVSNFVFGAMENKGLNIFNDKFILADPDSAVDADYVGIEAVIAHEYFHNWSGDRITCRDWFQLCLKEGFTVFRDQEFTSDMRSRAVKRIADVQRLRNTQFVEDASPLAHPVRPDRYREINNFYTTTIYEKGAELIRMLKTLLGAKMFREGCDLYFSRHDGQAVTIEDFIKCFADISNRDMAQFMRWYNQAGTPEVTVKPRYDEATKTYTLQFTQTIPPTPGQPTKEPHVIPIALGLLNEKGKELHNAVIVLDQSSQEFTFKVDERPVPSLLRGFSAPVRLQVPLSDSELALLAAKDSDDFNRWQAAQELALRHLLPLARDGKPGTTNAATVIEAYRTLMLDEKPEHAFRALALQLPTELDICRELSRDVDPDRVYAAKRSLQLALSDALGTEAVKIYRALESKGTYAPDPKSVGRRALRNGLLRLSTFAGNHLDIAEAQFKAADNLTDRCGALAALAENPGPLREKSLAAFEARYQNEPLVLDKWFALQALYAHDSVLATLEQLTLHPAFSFKTPNRVYALLNTFAQGNLPQFHRLDGAGYRFIGDCVIKLDPLMPSVSARLMTAFRSVGWLEEKRRRLACGEVEKIARTRGLSPDVADLSTRLLAA